MFDHKITVYSLPTLLKRSPSVGETYFDAWNQPLMYFKILCLSQQFEGALAFLSRIEGLRCHAVHLALLLREMKILLLPTSKQAPLGWFFLPFCPCAMPLNPLIFPDVFNYQLLNEFLLKAIYVLASLI